jgi:hypothetical protein
MDITQKIQQIFDIIKEIEPESPEISGILMEGLGLSLNIIESVIENNGRKNIDISEHLEMISRILGVSLTDLVMSMMNDTSSEQNDKVPDQETLDFITNDLDDYEKFLAQNKAKESLDFLSKEL